MSFKIDIKKEKRSLNIAQFGAARQKAKNQGEKLDIQNIAKKTSVHATFTGQGNSLKEETTGRIEEERKIDEVEVKIDRSLPTTKLRFRFPSEQRERIFNTNTSISSLIDFCSGILGYEAAVFEGFPPKELGRSEDSLEKLKILNTVLSVKKK
ncbi:Oidioi.mRNA.OKI2018_I69.chr1.g555.t1.cds [Oikopleura dioica]|uniref:Oidioi.mRNA.OKI2018_I69.chr1.g555.t1.cds n=1 Tax=Oikopleura dioica TaxID=34765 RepID=A0ABN7SPK8_OIKDI|nr:Oidioi.mRNA.OKI2018_I69.chr1.g555.t1.cds [Oikopleura dioica]